MSDADADMHNTMAEELPDSPLELAKVIDAAVGKLAALPLGLSVDAEVLEAVEVLEGAWRRADGANAALLVEVSDRELFRTVGQTSIKRFYAQHHRLGNGEAKRRVEVAEAIGVFTSMTGDKLPPKREPIAAAVAQGEVSSDHVHEVEQIMTKVPRSASPDEVATAVEIMATAARELAPADLRPVGQRLLAHLDPDGTLTDDTDRRRQRGFIIARQDAQLMSKVSGWLLPSTRAKLEVLLHNWAAPGMNNPDDAQSLVGSAAELCEHDREALAEAVKRDTRSSAQRNADALDRALDWVLGHGALGRPERLPAELVVTVDSQDLERHAGIGLTATGTMVPVGDLVELAADAVPWLEVFKGRTREILDLGRGKRFATKAQRIALFGRDRGCTRPGCTEPFCRTQAHHATADFADGGMTDVADLTGACGPDNRNVGPKPGQWETAIVADGPDQGRIGWRPAGTDLPYRTNPVHHPERFLRGHPVDGNGATETDSAAADSAETDLLPQDKSQPTEFLSTGSDQAASQPVDSEPAESRPPPMMRIRPDSFDVGHLFDVDPPGDESSPVETAIEAALQAAA
ncbi:HNH endonuclease signature motif containing protein [Gordonia crocea]|uniref:HNH endonuclease n=1 Tax=Gordonia crocea TaxID=589162 RepID=A0A7I9UWC3_9ACTN|nr:HNH endonuclease signature motif containing protein [Gordonia crocea]GED97071.1 HNH endonuclease [Gordonia crocea]